MIMWRILVQKDIRIGDKNFDSIIFKLIILTNDSKAHHNNILTIYQILPQQ